MVDAHPRCRMTTTSDFENVDYETSLKFVDDDQELWLVRLPKKFPLKKLPKKFHFDDTVPSQELSDQVVATKLTVGAKDYDLSVGNVSEHKQLYVMVGDEDEMQCVPFTRQLNVVQHVTVPKLSKATFSKPRVPPFTGLVLLQGTPSGYGTTPSKSSKTKRPKTKRKLSSTSQESETAQSNVAESSDIKPHKKVKRSPASKKKKKQKKQKKKK